MDFSSIELKQALDAANLRFQALQEQLSLQQAQNQDLQAKLRMSTAKAKAEHASLEHTISLLTCDKRDLFFAHILGGGYYQAPDAVHEDGAALEVDFPYPLFLVLVAQPESWGTMFSDGNMDQKDFYFILRNVLQNSFPGVTHAAEIKGNMAAIINLESLPEGNVDGILQAANRALEMLETEFGITVTVAISRVYQSVMELPRAMQDAELVLEYIDLIGEDIPITAYDQLTFGNMAPSTTSYIELESKLLSCAKYGDFSGVRAALHQLISNEFSDTKPTVDIFRYRIYGVTNTLLYLANDFRALLGNEIVDQLDPGPKLADARTLADLTEVMDDFLEGLESVASEKRQSGNTAWVEDIRHYVLEEYTSPDLTVSSIAEHFSFTPTYCSKKFRDQFGLRLFDYIQQQRLEKARELLCTQKTLEQIAEESGFSSALTMSRAFKRYDGAAPSLIRDTMMTQ